MTTPTREQVIEWAKEARLPDNQSGVHFFNRNLEVLATLAHAAGREQGLREAKEVCEAQAERFMQGSPLEGNKPYAARECAAAIEQLRGK